MKKCIFICYVLPDEFFFKSNSNRQFEKKYLGQKTLSYRVYQKKAALNIHEYLLCFTVEKTFSPWD